MKKQLLSLSLAAAMALSMSAPASAARVAIPTTPQSATDHKWAVTPVRATLSLDQVGAGVRANNPTVKALDETIASMEAMNWNKVISELEDAIDDIEYMVDLIKGAAGNINNIEKSLEQAFSIVDGALNSAGITSGISKLIDAKIYTSQLASLESSLESMEDQLDDLKEQKADYYKKTLPDTKRQLAHTVDQIVMGAESLYMTILSTQLQMDGLKDTKNALERTVAEMELRYERGQISQMTLTQVKNSDSTLAVNMKSLETAISTMQSSLQNLMGETFTRDMTLTALPKVSSGDLSGINYRKDLETAKETSYDLYAARRTVEDAKEDMEDARREEGKNSYQYKMAEHTHQSAVYQEEAAIANFEVSFLGLYNQLAPTQAALVTAESDLSYEEQVYQVAQLKYQQGNLSANALADAKDTYEAAKRDLTAAQTDLFTAWRNYQNAVAYGIVTNGA